MTFSVPLLAMALLYWISYNHLQVIVIDMVIVVGIVKVNQVLSGTGYTLCIKF